MEVLRRVQGAGLSVASLDVVCGGRLIVGAAAGYLVDEFAALGVPFEERNERSDEAIPAMKAAWTSSGGSIRWRRSPLR